MDWLADKILYCINNAKFNFAHQGCPIFVHTPPPLKDFIISSISGSEVNYL